ncbi:MULTISPECIES: alpha/beta fold hydrolase [Trichocoleus]|uniref:Alpha/beta hydrolase n=1 Tax=Trichocoleus desertorum GB2-A4 TaxID=2933944 RepID=A0ABV0J3X0_9CYAN|nr:alpha/beta hydrolase [Trichocoleus sp. FACHB-46]MBD1861822.1 alpha/beta hydrolase [Trichocoleus sp. FACHB-46]
MQSQTSAPGNQTVSPTQFYTWKGYRCAYEVQTPPDASTGTGTPLLLIHPIGVGLSRHFWQRFGREWYQAEHRNPIYNPDLLGCGNSDMPHVTYTPEDWAEQLQYFLQTVVQKPVIVVVQGALFPVAIALTQLQKETNLIRGLVLSGPPAWPVMTKASKPWQRRLSWNLFDSPLGAAFYRYARRPQFLRSFSTKQLFDRAEAVDQEWVDMLVQGAQDPASRHAVFAFLAGFWRQNYEQAIASIQQPTLVVVGETASSISRSGKQETPEQRIADYLAHLPQGRSLKMTGRNVMPYETTTEFVQAIAPFVQELSQ